MQGYIKIHRQLLENDLFTKEKYSKGQAWIALLLLTNHKDGYITIKSGEVVKVKRGECGYSMVALADRFKWDRRTVKRFLKFLENQKMVQQKIISNHTIITILNYDKYQIGTTECTTECTTKGTTKGTQTINEKNENNNTVSVQKNKNATPPVKVFKKPTLEEVENYIKEKNLSVDGEKFFNYYESIGWKVGRNPMKSWQSALNYWQRTEKKDEEESWAQYVDRHFKEKDEEERKRKENGWSL